MTYLGLAVFFSVVLVIFIPVFKSVERMEKKMTPYYNFDLYLPDANKWSALFFFSILMVMGLAIAFFIKIDISSISL